MPAKKKAAEPARLTVTLVKSLNGRHDTHIATAHSLGLKRPNDVVTQPDSAATRGKLAQISYLIKVETA